MGTYPLEGGLPSIWSTWNFLEIVYHFTETNLKRPMKNSKKKSTKSK